MVPPASITILAFYAIFINDVPYKQNIFNDTSDRDKDKDLTRIIFCSSFSKEFWTCVQIKDERKPRNRWMIDDEKGSFEK